MFTKPLTRQTLSTLDTSRDGDSIARLLVAAAISPKFCASLLSNPQRALQTGFGGEHFALSQPTLELLGSIRAATLPEFALKLNEVLSNQQRTT